MKVNIHFQITPHRLSEKSKKMESKAEAIFDPPFVAQSQAESMNTKLWKPGGQVKIRQSSSILSTFNEL